MSTGYWSRIPSASSVVDATYTCRPASTATSRHKFRVLTSSSTTRRLKVAFLEPGDSALLSFVTVSMAGTSFQTGATSVPNQEKVINRDICVTYHDNSRKLPLILLPNREIKQANSAPEMKNSHLNAGEARIGTGGFKTELFLGRIAPALSSPALQFPAMAPWSAGRSSCRSEMSVLFALEPRHSTL